MVELQQRRLLIDGEEKFLLSGEIHYYRLSRSEWLDRVRKTKELGCQIVAAYIPWIIHEEKRGEFDLTGKFRPENDLGAFIDLCASEGMLFIARPGPFIMAEMKNEGLPYWLYSDHPEIKPITWDGEPGRSKTVNYLAEPFLKAAREWYRQVMPVLTSRLQPKGGPVIGVQLDNEIGMLSWVNNQPDLNEEILCDFSRWLGEKMGPVEASRRYGFDLENPHERDVRLRKPTDRAALVFRKDYGDYQRDRFRRYVAELRKYAEEFGIAGVPFIVNIHGTGGGKATTFPIGLSQLMETWQEPGYLSGTDHYLGNLTRDNFQELWNIDAFTLAVSTPDQCLSSMEFEVGSGDYGDNGALRYGGDAADFKAKLSALKGNRLLNYYLLAGGRNPKLRYPVGDGNDRVAFTGERHGFAAPIDPEGLRSSTYGPLRETSGALNALGGFLAGSTEELDALTVGFIPDYYTTDYRYPGAMQAIVDEIQSARFPLEQMSRGFLLAGARFGALDIQNQPLLAREHPAFALGVGPCLDEGLQWKLLDYVRQGGRLFLHGLLPVKDMTGRPCRVLLQGLGLEAGPVRDSSDKFYPTLSPSGFLDGLPDIRVWRVQTVSGGRPVYQLVGGMGDCGVEASSGQGRALVFSFEHPSQQRVFSRIVEWLGVKPRLLFGAEDTGVVGTFASRKGEKVILAMNLDREAKEVRPTVDGWTFPREFVLGGREARLLPLGVSFGKIGVEWSTMEALSWDGEVLVFRDSPAGGRVKAAGASAVLGRESSPGVFDAAGGRLALRVKG